MQPAKIPLWSHSVSVAEVYVMHCPAHYFISLSLPLHALLDASTEHTERKSFCGWFLCSPQTLSFGKTEQKKNNILFTVSRYLHKLWDQLGITYIMNEFFLFVFHLTGGNEQKKKSGRFDWTPDTATAIRQYGVECGAVRIGINTLPCIVLYRRIVGFTFQSELFIFPFSVFIQNKRKYGICFGEVCPLKSTLS